MLSEAEQIAALDRVADAYEAREKSVDRTIAAGLKPVTNDQLASPGYWMTLLDMPSYDAPVITTPTTLDAIAAYNETNEVPDDERDTVYSLCWRQHVGHRLFRRQPTVYKCSCGQVLRFAIDTVESAMKTRGLR